MTTTTKNITMKSSTKTRIALKSIQLFVTNNGVPTYLPTVLQ